MKIDIHGCVFSLQLTWDFLLSWCRGAGRAVPSSLMRQFSQRTGVLRHAGVWAVRCEAGDISAQVGRPKPRVRQLIWGCLDHSVIGKLSCNITRAKNGGGKWPHFSNKTPSLNCDGNSTSDLLPLGHDGLSAACGLQFKSFQNTSYIHFK